MGRLLSSRQVRSALSGLALLLAAAALVAYPLEALEGARAGLDLCANVIVPSLFPFFVLSALILDLGFAEALGRALSPLMRPLFRLDGVCASALVLGLVGGYPVGARTAMELYKNGRCSPAEAQRMLAFCNNSGPAFIFGAVGAGVFGQSRIGLLLYGVHLLSSLLVGLLFRFYPENSGGRRMAGSAAAPPKPLAAAFTGAVTGAMGGALHISAFVLLFSIVIRLLSCSGVLPALVTALTALLAPLEVEGIWIAAWLTGLLELSGGVWALSELSNLSVGMTLAAFMLGWAGPSVHCQTLSFLGGSGLSCRSYFLGKLLHGVISAALLQVFLHRMPLPAVVYLAEQTETLTLLERSSTLTAATTASFALFALFLFFSAYTQRKRGQSHLKKH